ncbi:MAG: hypothetical protein WC150_11845 [Bacteroidia bacterium]
MKARKNYLLLLAAFFWTLALPIFAQQNNTWLQPLYYTAKKGENLKVVAKKYRLKEKTLVSRNRIAANYIFTRQQKVLVGYIVVPANQTSNPPEDAFLVDDETKKMYQPVDEDFLADSVKISAKEFAALTLPAEVVVAPAPTTTMDDDFPTTPPAPKSSGKTAPVKETPAYRKDKYTPSDIPVDTSGKSLTATDLAGYEEEEDPTINNITPDESELRTRKETDLIDQITRLEIGEEDSVVEYDFFDGPWLWAKYKYNTQPTIIQRGFIVLTFFTFCNLILFIVIISSRIYKNYVALRTKRLQEVYEPLLANLIFGEYDTEDRRAMIVRRIKKRYLVNEFNNEVFLQELLNLHKNFSGDVCDHIRQLYIEFGLVKYSMRKLKAFPWDIKIKGIRELTQMDIKDAYDEIFKYVDSKNSILRLETLLSLIQLSESDPLKFLSNTKANMTGWQQVNILAILSILNTDDLPDFKRWLNSPNSSVSLFTIRMINHFKQIGSVNSIVPMLDDPRESVREEVVNTIGNLELYGFADQLIEVYHREHDRLKIKILQVMVKISDDDQIPFFKQEMFNPNFAIAVNACIALAKIGPSGRKELSELLEDADERTTVIIKHALDKRIVN